MVDLPVLDSYFAILLTVFAGGVGIMMKVRSQDINRIERRVDDVLKIMNSTSQKQTEYLSEINASLKTMIEFMKEKR